MLALSAWGRRAVSLLLLLSACPVPAWACSVCFGLEKPLARAFGISGYVLILMPLVLTATLVGTLSMATRRAQRRQHSQKTARPAPAASVPRIACDAT